MLMGNMACPTVRRCFQHVVPWTSAHVDAHCSDSEGGPEGCETSAKKLEEGPRPTASARLVSRRAQLLPHLRSQAVRSSEQLAPPLVSRSWETECVMSSYSLAAQRAMETARIFSVSSDGGHLGDPPEKTHADVAWSPCVDMAVIWLPQVFS